MADSKNPKVTPAKASAGEEDKQSLASQDDKVAAAYENISKKLDSLRNGKEADSEEIEEESSASAKASADEEVELEEWKGPKPMKNPDVPEGEEEEIELRRVKLRNLERVEEEEGEEATERDNNEENDDGGEKDSKKHHEESDDEESEDDEIKIERDPEEVEDKQSLRSDDLKQSLRSDDLKPRKNWEPKENDPLDEEDAGEDSKGSKDTEESEDKIDDDKEAEDSEEAELPIHRTATEDDESVVPNRTRYSDVGTQSDMPIRKDPQPDTLDDLTDESASAKASADEDDDYFIPNLKGSGQRTRSMEYNAPIERESLGESYKQSLSPTEIKQSLRSDDLKQSLRSDDLKKSSMDNDPNNYFSQHSQPQPAKRANKFHLLILIIIGVVVIGFTVYILKGGFGDLSLTIQPSPSPSPVESASPTPTPTPEPDRAQFKVRILNGSGKTGLAKTVADKLKELGYQIDKTGNATNSAFEQTIIRVKTENESAIAQMVKDLSPDFDAAGNAGLKEDDTVDIEIILGAK